MPVHEFGSGGVSGPLFVSEPKLDNLTMRQRQTIDSLADFALSPDCRCQSLRGAAKAILRRTPKAIRDKITPKQILELLEVRKRNEAVIDLMIRG
ncbi:MAG: hypothetical protein R3A13_00480 [Bdellovibrionota bacterium]